MIFQQTFRSRGEEGPLPVGAVCLIRFTYLENVIVRGSHRKCSVKKIFLEISQNSHENTCARDSFLIKLQAYWNILLLEYIL